MCRVLLRSICQQKYMYLNFKILFKSVKKKERNRHNFSSFLRDFHDQCDDVIMSDHANKPTQTSEKDQVTRLQLPG